MTLRKADGRRTAFLKCFSYGASRMLSDLIKVAMQVAEWYNHFILGCRTDSHRQAFTGDRELCRMLPVPKRDLKEAIRKDLIISWAYGLR